MPRMQGGLTTDGRKLSAFLKGADGAKVSVGFLGGVTYDNGEAVGDVARKNEFGDSKTNVPPRPFMRPALENIKSQVGPVMADLSVAALDGSMSFDDVLTNIGLFSVNEVRSSIESVTSPALSLTTIVGRRMRGNSSTKPLEDTMKMKDSVDFEVSNE